MEPTSPSEFAQVLAAARNGSSAALGQVLQACRQYLLFVAASESDSALHAKGGASDLVQETLLKATQHFDRFHGDSPSALQAWLRRILLNNLANLRRRYQATGKRQLARECSLEEGDSRHNLYDDLAQDTPTPGGQAVRREVQEALAQALAQLPEDYRQVLRWRYEEQRSFEEIGRLLGRSADAARMLWGRAIARLRPHLREYA